jgi:hypothetical protein
MALDSILVLNVFDESVLTITEGLLVKVDDTVVTFPKCANWTFDNVDKFGWDPATADVSTSLSVTPETGICLAAGMREILGVAVIFMTLLLLVVAICPRSILTVTGTKVVIGEVSFMKAEVSVPILITDAPGEGLDAQTDLRVCVGDSGLQLEDIKPEEMANGFFKDGEVTLELSKNVEVETAEGIWLSEVETDKESWLAEVETAKEAWLAEVDGESDTQVNRC